MESMKQKFFRAAVPLVMLAVSAALSVFVYRLPQPVREPLPVLMYHHMVPDGQDCNDMTVTPGKFRADLETVLAMGYTPVLPRELAAGDALPEKPILITFDDGYRSNYDLVYPILREYGVKGLHFHHRPHAGSAYGQLLHLEPAAGNDGLRSGGDRLPQLPPPQLRRRRRQF